jgi:chromosome partitioning protein
MCYIDIQTNHKGVTMEPKMTVPEAAEFLGVTSQAIVKKLRTKKLSFKKTQHRLYFGYETSKKIFGLKISPKIYAIQIVKGGTGKSTLTMNLAVRANLYGLKVLCIDLDQQANLTVLFGYNNVENCIVMYDILQSGGKLRLEENLIEITAGLHLFPSRLENAALDDEILVNGLGIDRVYRDLIEPLKAYYDLILIDCPPALGRSVAAAAHASDKIITPVIPDTLCITGLNLLEKMLTDIQNSKYGRKIPYEIIYNRFDNRTFLSKDILSYLLTHDNYKNRLNENYIRQSQDFPNAAAMKSSVFDSLKPSNSKDDIDLLIKSLLSFPSIEKEQPMLQNPPIVSITTDKV